MFCLDEKRRRKTAQERHISFQKSKKGKEYFNIFTLCHFFFKKAAKARHFF